MKNDESRGMFLIIVIFIITIAWSLYCRFRVLEYVARR